MNGKKIYLTGSSCISPQATHDKAHISLGRVYEDTKLRCIEPDYTTLPQGIIGRRMGKLTKIGITAAFRALEEAGVKNPDAIITGTGLGCMVETEKFLYSVLENDEQLVNPTAFMQSTHNTLGGQIALMLGCKNYNFTYVHKGFAFESALLDGMLRIWEGEGSDVLVGSFDEVTDWHFKITSRLHYWKENMPSDMFFSRGGHGTLAGEGAAFFTLSDKAGTSTVSTISALEMCYLPDNAAVIQDRITSLLNRSGLTADNIDLLISGRTGDNALDTWFDEVEGWLGIPVCYFKHLSGEYYTASSFALWLADYLIRKNDIPAELLPESPRGGDLKNILIYNHYRNTDHAIYLVQHCRNSG